MKSVNKFATVLLVLVLVVAMAACSGNNKQPEQSAQPQQTATPKPSAQPSEAPKTNYPEKTITIIVAWAAGGGTDAVARSLAEEMKKLVDVDIIVVNKEGAGSAIGSREVMLAAPDGYTLLFNTASVITQTFMGQQDGTNTIDYTKMIPVAITNTDPYTMEANKNAKWNTLAEMIEDAKKAPRSVTVAVAGGAGSQSQLLIPMIENLTGVEFKQVPYEGAGPSNVALMGGHVDAHGPALGDFVSFIKSGEIKLLGIAADERSPEFPDVPTFKEQGIDLSYGLFRGIWAPAGTPDDVVKAIEELVLQAAESPGYKETLAKLGYGHAAWGHERSQAVADEQAVALKEAMIKAGVLNP